MGNFDPQSMTWGTSMGNAFSDIADTKLKQEQLRIQEKQVDLTNTRAKETYDLNKLVIDLQLKNVAKAEERKTENTLRALSIKGTEDNFVKRNGQMGIDLERAGLKDGLYRMDDIEQFAVIKKMTNIIEKNIREATTLQDIQAIKSWLLKTGTIEQLNEYAGDVNSTFSNDEQMAKAAILGVMDAIEEKESSYVNIYNQASAGGHNSVFEAARLKDEAAKQLAFQKTQGAIRINQAKKTQ